MPSLNSWTSSQTTPWAAMEPEFDLKRCWCLPRQQLSQWGVLISPWRLRPGLWRMRLFQVNNFCFQMIFPQRGCILIIMTLRTHGLPLNVPCQWHLLVLVLPIEEAVAFALFGSENMPQSLHFVQQRIKMLIGVKHTVDLLCLEQNRSILFWTDWTAQVFWLRVLSQKNSPTLFRLNCTGLIPLHPLPFSHLPTPALFKTVQ